MALLGLGPAMIALFVGFGLLIGLLFGFFGMGGSFLVVPALLVTGYPIKVAVGSGLAFVFGTSVIATLRHRNYGQVDFKLAALMSLGMTLGIAVGKRAMFLLETVGSADALVSAAYVGLLALVGAFTWRDARRPGVGSRELHLAGRIRALRLSPRVTLAGGNRVSAWVVLGVGGLVGSLSGFLGVGGGFLLLPAMLYGFGVPATVAVGTDLLQITVAGAYGAFVYADAEAVAVPAVGALLAGSALGARIGAGATKLVDEDGVKGYFAAVLLAGSLSVAASELSSRFGIEALNTVSIVLIFGVPLLMGATVLIAAIRGLQRDITDGTNRV